MTVPPRTSASPTAASSSGERSCASLPDVAALTSGLQAITDKVANDASVKKVTVS